jgi:hypothetical protein
MRRLRRLGTSTATLAALVVLLSGCIKLEMDLEVAADDTVSGTAVLGFSRQLMELGGGSLDDLFGAQDVVPSDVEGVTIEPYEDDDFVGQEVTFDAVPLARINEQADEGSLTIVRDGDRFRVSGELDLATGDVPGGPEDLPFDPETLFQDAVIRISLTFPGEVERANGEIDGNTVTWTPSVGDRLVFEAVASAIPSGGGLPIVWIVLAVLAVAAVAGAVILANRRRPAPTAGWEASAEPAAGGQRPPPPDPAVSETPLPGPPASGAPPPPPPPPIAGTDGSDPDV